jgi:hypothetical protein
MLGQAARPEPTHNGGRSPLEALDASAVAAVAELAGEALGAMVVVTGMDGRPVTPVAHPCGLFAAIADDPAVPAKCVATWAHYGAVPDLTPALRPSVFGFLCARSFIRVGAELLGMVIVGGIAPEEWPPSAAEIDRIAVDLEVDRDTVLTHIEEVYRLDESEQQRLLRLLPQFSVVLSHMAESSGQLVDRLDAIASLAGDVDSRSAT